MIRPQLFNALPLSYRVLDPLPWRALAGPMAEAEDSMARLDERLSNSPIREGFIARANFSDACAAIWLEGTAVHVEDLVLHDAEMDVRAPTHDLTRAHAALRARRRIAAAKPDWALSDEGLAGLRGRAGDLAWDASEDNRLGLSAGRAGGSDDEDAEEEPLDTSDPACGLADSDPRLAEASAEVDAAMQRASRAVAGAEDRRRQARQEKDPLIHDPDYDEDGRLAEWRAVAEATRGLPATLAAAILLDAWDAIAPLEHEPWLGKLLVAALIRQRGKTSAHLVCLHEGFRALPYERRRMRDPATRLVVALEAMTAGAQAGLKAHDRWLIARTVLSRKLVGRRSSSRLPALVDYVLSRPIVSAGMIAKGLGITPRAAQNLVAELGLREATGRERYRAWGIL